ncbi:hypothetical protein U6T99_12240, partial [Cutibacterium acnes]
PSHLGWWARCAPGPGGRRLAPATSSPDRTLSLKADAGLNYAGVPDPLESPGVLGPWLRCDPLPRATG